MNPPPSKLAAVLNVRCKSTTALLYTNKYETGSKGKCIQVNKMDRFVYCLKFYFSVKLYTTALINTGKVIILIQAFESKVTILQNLDNYI